MRSNDIGAVLVAYRRHRAHGHRPLPQTELARWLGLSQARLCRLENQQAHLDHASLARVARILGIPEELRWFDAQDDHAAADAGSLVRLPSGKSVPAMAAPVRDSLAATLLAALGQYAALDMLAGPRDLLDLVANQMATIDSTMHRRSGAARAELTYAAARFAEFLGWINQDAGNLDAAMYWSHAAQDHAETCGDRPLRAYVLMRKSNIAGDAGDFGAAVALADESIATTADLTSRQRAVLLRQKGHAYAQRTTVTGDRRDLRTCIDALTQAADLARDDTSPAGSDLAQYCSPGYVAMEAAHCWVQLGRPEKALATLEAGLVDWAPGNHRDLGMGFARLATAYAELGQPDNAVDVATHALTIHADTGSQRTLRQLHSVGTGLAKRGHRGRARDFAAMLRAHLTTTGTGATIPEEEFEWS